MSWQGEATQWTLKSILMVLLKVMPDSTIENHQRTGRPPAVERGSETADRRRDATDASAWTTTPPNGSCADTVGTRKLAVGGIGRRWRAGRRNLIADQDSKAQRPDPGDYLRPMLNPIAHPPVKRIHELLPWNLAGVRERLDRGNVA